MGSYGSADSELSRPEDEITVLVTGFGPFRFQNPTNPSWEIARALPPFLPPSDESSPIRHAHVRILTHPEAVRVAYKEVRELIPSLWDGRKVDFAVHIGMAAGRQFYSVERRGHRDGYAMQDVDNQLLGDGARRAREKENWIWNGLPEELLSSCDIDDIWKRWRLAMPNTDVRVSEDAGRYLCDFIFFSSLAHLTKKSEERRVVFLHVPVESDEAAIKTGVEVTIELIRAIVRSSTMKNTMNNLKASAGSTAMSV